MTTRVLTYLDTRVRVSASIETAECMDRVFGFLASHFGVTDGTPGPVETVVDVRPYPDLRVHEHSSATPSTTVMKRASRQKYVIRGVRHVTPDGHLIVSPEVGTAYLLDYRNGAATLFVSPGSWVHVIEFFRALVWAVEEAHGTVVLHAAAVGTPSGVIALTGAKGAGKTTTLLDLLDTGAFTFVSGDKLFARPAPDGGVLVSGWPDFPHLGWGTIRARPELFRRITTELGLAPGERDTDKVVLPHDWYREVIGFDIDGTQSRLEALLLPAIDIGNPAPGRLEPAVVSAGDVAGLVESRRSPGTREGWEPYFSAVIRRAVPAARHRIEHPVIAELPAFFRYGSGPLTGLGPLAPSSETTSHSRTEVRT